MVCQKFNHGSAKPSWIRTCSKSWTLVQTEDGGTKSKLVYPDQF